jgi:hypothetical protein
VRIIGGKFGGGVIIAMSSQFPNIKTTYVIIMKKPID